MFQTVSRQKKIINSTNIPQHEIDAIARCLLPYIQQSFESEEGQREFAEWKKQQEMTKIDITENLKS